MWSENSVLLFIHKSNGLHYICIYNDNLLKQNFHQKTIWRHLTHFQIYKTDLTSCQLHYFECYNLFTYRFACYTWEHSEYVGSWSSHYVINYSSHSLKNSFDCKDNYNRAWGCLKNEFLEICSIHKTGSDYVSIIRGLIYVFKRNFFSFNNPNYPRLPKN